MKFVILIIFLLSFADAKTDIRSLQYSGVKVTQNGKPILIERIQNGKCLDIPITPKSLYSSHYIEKEAPKECKKTFLTMLGTLQPISIDKDIKTVGELEVLAHIKNVEHNPLKYILLDARRADWYEQITIPTAVNLPYNEIVYDEDFKEDFKKMLKMLNIKKTKTGLDFSQAKTALLFCNGSWCVQSSKAIFILIDLGYPKEKLLWYRGGLQDWLAYGLTTTLNSQ
jgi:rhodanese-related sulfurtransferase